MEFFVILLLVLCIYFWMQNNSLRDQNSNNRKSTNDKTIKRNITYEETSSPNARASQVTLRTQNNNNPQTLSVSNRRQSNNNSPTLSEPKRRQSDNKEPTLSVPNRRQNTEVPKLNTGIPGLDGPGVYHRLFQFGQTGEALYLLYSRSHNAYKIGHSRPGDLEQRIRRIQPEVPDIALEGLNVFTSAQNAHNREQEILQIYSNKKYRGITGRYAGRTEWLTVRPSRPKSIKSIKKIEEEFNKDKNSSAQEIQVQDLYTFYLMHSPNKGMYYCSWCNSENLRQKIITQQRKFSSDAYILSRMPFDSQSKARATCNEFNKLTNSYERQGRQEIREWTEKTNFLGKFRNWDEKGRKV